MFVAGRAAKTASICNPWSCVIECPLSDLVHFFSVLQPGSAELASLLDFSEVQTPTSHMTTQNTSIYI